MTTLAKPLREKLAEHYVVQRPERTGEQKSTDGTAKWLYRFEDGNEAETVYIPETDRGAVCISTQVGCTLTCRFCHTGTQLLVRNLTAGEIVGQFMAARDAYDEWPTPNDGTRLLSNIVVMGMGEPLFNYEAVRDAMHLAMDNEGPGHFPAPHHPIDLRRHPGDEKIRRGGQYRSGHQPACGQRRPARRIDADQQEIPARRAVRRLPRIPRGQQMRGASLLNTCY